MHINHYFDMNIRIYKRMISVWLKTFEQTHINLRNIKLIKHILNLHLKLKIH